MLRNIINNDNEEQEENTDENQEISRRQFGKVLGAGGVGAGILAMSGNTAAATTINPDYLSLDDGGDVRLGTNDDFELRYSNSNTRLELVHSTGQLIWYVNNSDGSTLNIANRDIDVGGNTVTNLPTPSNNSDAATKQYVDDNAGGTTSPTVYSASGSTYSVPTDADVVKIENITAPDDWTLNNVNFQGAGTVSGYTSLVTVQFNGDGTKMFVQDTDAVEIVQTSLSTAWDATTNSVDTSQSAQWNNFVFNGDGTDIIGDQGTSLVQYSLDAGAYDISNGFTDTGNTYSTGFSNDITSLDFAGDGEFLYLTNFSNNTVLKLQLSTPYDISTASQSQSVSVSGSSGYDGIMVKNDGSKMFLNGGTGTMYEYEFTGGNGDLNNASQIGTYDYSAQTTTGAGLAVVRSGREMYIPDFGSNAVYWYTLEDQASLGSIDLAGTPDEGTELLIKDLSGQAGTDSVPVTGLVDSSGSTTYSIDAGDQASKFVYLNSNWYLEDEFTPP